MEHTFSTSGTVRWQSPSNIALVKYWGKHGRQLPGNPSISLTLDKAHTVTEISYRLNDTNREQPKVQFKFEGKEAPDFKSRIEKYLSGLTSELPFLKKVDLDISSSNSFPHSSGIASSASSMSALALCLMQIENQLEGITEIDYQRASHIARLGSGSASRSVYGPIAVWGETNSVPHSSDLHAIPYLKTAHDNFQNFHDDILIISKKKKSVSSSAGHDLMTDNPYKLSRYKQAHRHVGEIIDTIQNGDLEAFGDLVEKEALTLHALMMASTPPYMLMEPNTINAIKLIQQFRKEENVPVYFTLDAGPNIHLLYPDLAVNQVKQLKSQLIPLCEEGMIIEDVVGQGPKALI